MASELPYEKILQESLKNELRVVNAHLPRQQKPLSGLLEEEYPHVVCGDGSMHLFKKKELEYLAGMLSTEEQQALFLPILIELGPEDEVTIISKEGIEEKIISEVLDMPVTYEQGKIKIYKSQLGVLRKALRTTTQYIFSTTALT